MSTTTFPVAMREPIADAGDKMGSVRAAGLTGYADLVTQLGGKPTRLLARCGLDLQIIDNHENIIPFRVTCRLLELTAEETCCPHFGLLLGQHRSRSSIAGPPGFLAQHSSNVEEALNNLSHYLHLHCVGASIALLVQRSEAIVTFATDLDNLVGMEQTMELGTVDVFMFMRMICGREWLPNSVHYGHPPPPDIAPYRALFRAPVHFNRAITSLRFPAFWLERPVLNANPDLHRILQTYVENLERQYSGNFPGKIRRIVGTMLPTGKCTADRVAVLLSMHRRTLHRHLVANGTTFEKIVDDARNEMAVRNLTATDMSINNLAAMLGYRDTSSFIRAFRRWSGVSPTEWREKHRS